LKRWQAALDTLAGAQEALKTCDAKVAETAAKASELTRTAAELSGLLEPKREEQLIAAALLARLNAAKELLEADENAANKEIEKLKAQQEQFAGDLQRETAIVGDAAEAEARLAAEYESLAAIKDTSAALDSAADAAAEAIKLRNSLDANYNELTRKSADQNARRDAANREVTQLQSRLSRMESEHGDNTERLAGMQKDGGSSANLFAAGAKDALAALEAARAHEQALSAKRAETEGADQIAREALADARQALSKLTAEQAALERILSRGGSADWTPALDEMQAKTGYEQALAAALGEDLDAAIGGNATLRWTNATVPSQAR